MARSRLLIPVSAAPLCRRACLRVAIAAAAALPPALTSASTPTARVATYPGVEYLEPIYELKLSLDALAAAAAEPERWPALRKRLDKFFSGGPLSERYYYAGLSLQYDKKITYDDLDQYVADARKRRELQMEAVLGAMDAMRAALNAKAPQLADVASRAKEAQAAMGAWLALVPEADVRRADELFRATRTADTDRNGRLDQRELAGLAEADRLAWQARVALVGD